MRQRGTLLLEHAMALDAAIGLISFRLGVRCTSTVPKHGTYPAWRVTI